MGKDFSFAAIGNGIPSSYSMDRSLSLEKGSYTVKVQGATGENPPEEPTLYSRFVLDSWSLTVEQAKSR